MYPYSDGLKLEVDDNNHLFSPGNDADSRY